ncbi:MAG: hypothetical protein HFG67_03240, partial [Firmicutes bacterium]|nr:hypothetical protein [Bacillota bacterium]
MTESLKKIFTCSIAFLIILAMLLSDFAYAFSSIGIDAAGDGEEANNKNVLDENGWTEDRSIHFDMSELPFQGSGQKAIVTACYTVLVNDGEEAITDLESNTVMRRLSDTADAFGNVVKWETSNEEKLSIDNVSVQLVEGRLAEDGKRRLMLLSTAEMTWNSAEMGEDVTYTATVNGTADSANPLKAEGKAYLGMSEEDPELAELLEQLMSGQDENGNNNADNESITNLETADSIKEQIKNAETIEVAKFFIEMYTEMGHGRLSEEEVAELGVDVDALIEAGYSFDASDDDMKETEVPNLNVFGDLEDDEENTEKTDSDKEDEDKDDNKDDLDENKEDEDTDDKNINGKDESSEAENKDTANTTADNENSEAANDENEKAEGNNNEPSKEELAEMLATAAEEDKRIAEKLESQKKANADNAQAASVRMEYTLPAGNENKEETEDIAGALGNGQDAAGGTDNVQPAPAVSEDDGNDNEAAADEKTELQPITSNMMSEARMAPRAASTGDSGYMIRVEIGRAESLTDYIRDLTGSSAAPSNLKLTDASLGTISGTNITGAKRGRTKLTMTVNGQFYVTNLEVVGDGEIAVPQIVAGTNHMAVLKADGTVWTWGASIALGNGNTGNSNTPVQVKINAS